MSSVIVKNLPKKITEENIRKIFGKRGLLADVKLKHTSEGTFVFAFLVYQSEREAKQAVKDFNNTSILSNTIVVEALADQRRSKSANPPSKENDCNDYMAQSFPKKSVTFQTHSTAQAHHTSRRSQQSLQVPTERERSTSLSYDDIRFTSTPFQQSSSIQMGHSSRNTERALHVPTTRRKSTSPCDDPRYSSSRISTLTVEPYKSRDSNVRSVRFETNSNLEYCSELSTASSVKDKKENVSGRRGSSSTQYDCNAYLTPSLSKNSSAAQTYSTVEAQHASKLSQQSLQVPTERGRSKSSSYDDIRFTSTPFQQSSSVQMGHSSRNTERALHVPTTRRKSTSPCDDPRYSSSRISTLTVEPYHFKDFNVRSVRSEANSNLGYCSKLSTASSVKDKENISGSRGSSSTQYDCNEYQAQSISQNSLAAQTQQSLQIPTARGRSKSSSYDDIIFTSTPFQQCSSSQMGHSSRSTVRTLTVEPFKLRDSGVSSMESEDSSLQDEYVNGRCDSSMGSRYPSYLNSLPDGQLPIKGSKVEIVWGCVKMGRTQSQSFQIQNQLHQKIPIEVSVVGSNFKLIKEGNASQVLTTLDFTLHAYETKTLTVIFQPSKIGAISDKVVFYPCSNSDSKKLKQTIRLFGYGGHISVDLTKMFKVSNGHFWLSMGVFDRAPIIQKFSIKNTGVLSAFAIIELENNGLMPKSTNVKINPMEMVLKPQQEVKVTIMYSPKTEDYKSQNDIINVGSFKFISGAEVDRARIRRLCSILSQKNENINKTIKSLSKQLPGEDTPRDLGILIEETSTSIYDLLKCITVKQIHVNIEKNPNVTMEMHSSFFNDSTMFKTLYQDSTTIQDENEFNKSNRLFTVDPNRILFSLPSKIHDRIIIQSKSKTPERFKVIATEGFTVSPPNGVVSSDKFAVIIVRCTRMQDEVGKLQVCIKNETSDVDLKAIVSRN
ncbi:uncharacterized protein [Onthophagus taurus]|uniref:uncharacterized protein n=1 Tax=Onthophagus taurus TaxID=166361 RepID=UPI0039BE01AB